MPSPFPAELRWLFPKIKSQLRLHLGSFLCLTLASLLALVTPFAMRWLIDTILPGHDSRLLLVAIGLVFGSYEAKSFFSAVGSYLTFRATQHTALAVRMSLLRHLDTLSADYYDRTPVGALLYPFEGPIEELSYFGSDLLPSILRAVVATGVTLTAMVALSPLLALVAVPLVPPFLLLRHRYRKRLGQQADEVQAAKSGFAGFLEEHLSAVTELQLLGHTGAQERRAAALLDSAVASQNSLRKTAVFFSAFSSLTIATGMAAVLALGSVLVFRHRLTIGTLIAFYSLLLQLFDPLAAAMEMYSRAQRTFSSIRQIQALLATPPAVGDDRQAKPFASDRPLDIEFRNVSFGYRGKSTRLYIPRLEIFQGERVAIVGPNGAGKSTLGKLLVRAYDVESGEIAVAGRDLRTVTLASLRSAVCYLPAQPILFQGSLADNLHLGRGEFPTGELKRVLAIVGLTRYQGDGSDALEKRLEPGASNLSDGERQRIAIARALLQRPRILILDETTSSLDSVSEQTILYSLDRELPESTLIVMSHRLDTIRWMRRILLLRNGEIAGDGHHEVLRTTNPLYAELVASRWSEGLETSPHSGHLSPSPPEWGEDPQAPGAQRMREAKGGAGQS